MKRLTSIFIGVVLGLTSLLRAAEEINEATSASGIWKWTFTMPDGSKVEPRAKLHQEGDTLTGTAKIREGLETDISEGKVSGNEVSFAVVRERDGHKITTIYKGLRTSNHIKGTIESDWNGTTQTYVWEARRFSKDPTGTWAWKLPNRRGRTNEFKLTLIQQTNELTGIITFFGNEIEIEEGKVKNGEISFSVPQEVNEDIITWNYKGRVISDTIKGRVELIGGERDRLIEWTAHRTD